MSMDTDFTGEIDIEEFANERLVSKSAQGAKLFKGMAVGFGEMADHQKHTGSFISQDRIQADMKDGVVGDGAGHRGGLLDEKIENDLKQSLGRPLSASTIASEGELRDGQATLAKGARPQSATGSQKSLSSLREGAREDEYSWGEDELAD